MQIVHGPRVIPFKTGRLMGTPSPAGRVFRRCIRTHAPARPFHSEYRAFFRSWPMCQVLFNATQRVLLLFFSPPGVNSCEQDSPSHCPGHSPEYRLVRLDRSPSPSPISCLHEEWVVPSRPPVLTSNRVSGAHSSTPSSPPSLARVMTVFFALRGRPCICGLQW